MQTEEIKQLIEQAIAGADVAVDGDGYHFTTQVVSTEFEGKSRVQRQQMVYQAVNEHIASGALHALSIQALTPDEVK